MNLSVDCREKAPSLSPSIVPLLVLVKEWSDFKEDAFLQNNLILVLLQGVQALSEGSGKVRDMAYKLVPRSFVRRLGARLTTIRAEPCPNFLELKLKEIGDESLSSRFTKTLGDVCQELTSFMDLFDHLGRLFTPANENSPPLLDADCKNSVLGTFIRHCVLEYKKLTFSQLVQFHGRCPAVLKEQKKEKTKDSTKAGDESLLTRKDFTAALRHLTLSGRDRHDNHELGSEALKLAELHGKFGHQEEGTFALHEAIRLAMQNKHTKSLLLEHTMAWLHQLQPYNGEDSLIILDRFIETTQHLALPLLSVWGKLQLTKSQSALAQEPTKVLQTLLTGEVDFSPVYMYENQRKKLTQKSSSLALQAGLWNQYGQRLLGLLYSQLQCHMTSCDPLLEEGEAFSLSVCALARDLAETGKFETSQSLLATTRKHFSGTGLPYKLLCQCDKETSFDRAVLECDFNNARRHLRGIATLDKHSASYRSAILAKAEGNLHSAFEQAQYLLKELQRSEKESQNITLQTRLLILLAEVHMAYGYPAMALPHILECISLCDQHHLPSYHAALCLAEIQLQLGSPKDCLTLVKECLLQCQANSAHVDRGIANLLLTQATLCSAKQTSRLLTKEDVLGVIPVLAEAITTLRQCSALQRLKMALILQTQLYNFIGYFDERDKTSKLIVKLESNIKKPCL